MQVMWGGGTRNAETILMAKPLGRPTRRWHDIIKIDLREVPQSALPVFFNTGILLLEYVNHGIVGLPLSWHRRLTVHGLTQ
jgi:hypothetical protein